MDTTAEETSSNSAMMQVDTADEGGGREEGGGEGGGEGTVLDLAAIGLSPQRGYPHHRKPHRWCLRASMRPKVVVATAVATTNANSGDGHADNDSSSSGGATSTLKKVFDSLPGHRQYPEPMLQLFAIAHAPAPDMPNRLLESGGGGGGGEEEQTRQAPQSLLRLLPIWSNLPLDEQTLEEELPFHTLPPMQSRELSSFNMLLHEAMIFPAAVPTSPMLVVLDHQHMYTPTMMNHQMLRALYDLVRVLEKTVYQRVIRLENEEQRAALLHTLEEANSMREKKTDALYNWLNIQMKHKQDDFAHALSKAAVPENKENATHVPRSVDNMPEAHRNEIICHVGSLLELFLQRYVNLLEEHAFLLSSIQLRQSKRLLPKDKWPESGIPPIIPGHYQWENPEYWINVPKPLRPLFSQTVPIKKSVADNSPDILPMFLRGCTRVTSGLDDVELLAAQLGVVRHAWRMAEGRESENPFFNLGSMSAPVREAISRLERDKKASLLYFRDRMSDQERFKLRSAAFLCYLQARLVAPNYTPQEQQGGGGGGTAMETDA